MGNKGTIGFNAPEQFVTIWQDESCDVYRRGMNFYITMFKDYYLKLNSHLFISLGKVLLLILFEWKYGWNILYSKPSAVRVN